MPTNHNQIIFELCLDNLKGSSYISKIFTHSL